MAAGWIIVIIVAIIVVVVVARSVRIIPQARAGVVERLGAFKKVLNPGLALLMPFVDRMRATIDMREQVVSFPPQPVITSDNLTVSIDTVVYFQVTNPYDATYSIANYIQAVEQLTITTLRNVVGGMNLEEALTSRDRINTRLRGELDEATGTWGIRVGRVELKAIDPPPSIQDSMEKQMRADRDKRAIILQAEGQRESAIKTAEGEKAALILSAEGQRQSIILQAEAERQSRILKAEGERAARYLSSQGQAKAIETVFRSIHLSNPDPKLLAYQYLQTLPQIAQGDANKMWIIPTEFSKALDGLSRLGDGSDEGSSGSWLTNAGSGGPTGMLGESDLDATDWFESKLAPEPVSAQDLRASDHDPDSRLAHQGLPDSTGQLTPSVSIPSVSVPEPVIPDATATPQTAAPEEKKGPDTAEQPVAKPAEEPASDGPYRPQLPRQGGGERGDQQQSHERQRWSQQGGNQPREGDEPRRYNNPPPWQSGPQK